MSRTKKQQKPRKPRKHAQTPKKKSNKKSNKKSILSPAKPTSTEKSNIRKILNPITDTQMQTEYNKLKSMGCKGAKRASSVTRTGNTIVDRFTMKERLHTKGHQQIDFYTFWKHRAHYRKIPYIKKMIDFYKTRKIDELRKFKYIFNLYFSSISIFRPIVAMEVYCKINATRVLDFTMGWGGRLVGAYALGLDAYIGIDANPHLEKPYQELTDFLQDQENENETTIDLHFQDATTFDYSTVTYDAVFTSPPYYDLEMYRRKNNDTREKTKEEWHESFYFPVFRETWKHLQHNGHYCLNVPKEIYEDACIPILGKAHKKFPLKKKQRSDTNKYSEFIYVWVKSDKS